MTFVGDKKMKQSAFVLGAVAASAVAVTEHFQAVGVDAVRMESKKKSLEYVNEASDLAEKCFGKNLLPLEKKNETAATIVDFFKARKLEKLVVSEDDLKLYSEFEGRQIEPFEVLPVHFMIIAQFGDPSELSLHNPEDPELIRDCKPVKKAGENIRDFFGPIVFKLVKEACYVGMIKWGANLLNLEGITKPFREWAYHSTELYNLWLYDGWNLREVEKRMKKD